MQAGEGGIDARSDPAQRLIGQIEGSSYRLRQRAELMPEHVRSKAILVVGMAGGRSAELSDTMEACRHDNDLNQRVAACAEVTGRSSDRRVLLRAHNIRGLALCDLNR